MTRIIRARDADGTPMVGVLLSNRRERVWLNLEDFNRLPVEVTLRRWWLTENRYGGSSYVVVGLPKTSSSKRVAVSRLIANVHDNRRVFVKDGNPFNLRRANLRIRDNDKAPAKRLEPAVAFALGFDRSAFNRHLTIPQAAPEAPATLH